MDTQHPLRYFVSSVSKMQRFFITASRVRQRSEILLPKKAAIRSLAVLLPGFANDHEIARAENDKLYVRTNLDSNRTGRSASTRIILR